MPPKTGKTPKKVAKKTEIQRKSTRIANQKTNKIPVGIEKMQPSKSPPTTGPTAADWASFVEAMERSSIPIHEPGSRAYRVSTATVNQLFRLRKPKCVVQPDNTADVQKIVKQAKKRDMPIMIKNGGHSYSGASSARGGILLDLQDMRRVTIDGETEIVTIQGGALWAHVYLALARGRVDGYVVSGGRCPAVGVSGFVLGGGIGPFTRQIGMGSDSLIRISLVTADGKLVTVRREDDPKTKEGRLFWALCGAGGGNFGVVVEVEMELKKLNSEWVTPGRFTWYPENREYDALLGTMDGFYSAQWTDLMTIDSTWLVDLRPTFGTSADTRLGIRFTTYYNGEGPCFEREINQHITSQELATEFKSTSLTQKSTQFLYETLGEQWKEDTTRSEPSRKTHQLYSSFVFEANQSNMQSVARIVRDELERFRATFRNQRCLAQCTFIHAGGEASKKRRSETAFRWRECVHHGYIMIEYDDAFVEKRIRQFFGEFKNQLKPFSMMGRAAFINFPDNTYNQESYQRKYFGRNRRKLQQVKKTWDKDNYFDWFQGIRQEEDVQQGIVVDESDDSDSVGESDDGIEEVVTRTVIQGEDWEAMNLPDTDVLFAADTSSSFWPL